MSDEQMDDILKHKAHCRMRKEMIYVPVQVHLEYEEGSRSRAVAGAKEMVSAAVKGSHAKCQSYRVKSNGKIRSRKLKH